MSMILDHTLTLVIADIVFSVHCHDFIIFHESAEDPYRQFITSEQNTSVDRPVTVALLLTKIPNVTGFTKIFDSNTTWSLFENGLKRYIHFRDPLDDTHPLWVAEMDTNNRHVDVYCSHRLLSKLDTGEPVIVNPLSYPLDQILLMQFLGTNGFTVHAAGTILNNEGNIFAGPSGAGKSTITGLLSDLNEFTLLSDDRIVIRQLVTKNFIMYGTPWAGEANIAVNANAPLKKIFFLEKGEKNLIRELSAEEALGRIMPVVSLPWYDKHLLSGYLDTCGKLLQHTNTYSLSFTTDHGSVNELISLIND